MTQITRLSARLWLLALLAAMPVATAHAGIDLRVQSRPNTGPIDAYVRVTNAGGPVSGLTGNDFVVTLDGAALPTFGLNLPPDQDAAQKVSVLFVIDRSRSMPQLAMPVIQDAVVDFINQMAVGDYAAIVKFRFDPNIPMQNSVVQPFTQVDGGAGTSMLISAAAAPFFGNDTPAFDALILAIDQFTTSPAVLPDGPKAIILIDDGLDNPSYASQSDVVAHANASGIPIFTVGIGDVGLYPWATGLMQSLAEDSGGIYLASLDDAQIATAHANLASLLHSAYRLRIPQTAVTDCNPHMLEITAQGQSESVAFTRCDTTPDQFLFTPASDVARGAVVVSDTATITGIVSPVQVTVTGGQYSIGCGATFTSAPGIIVSGDSVCVRQVASGSPGTTSDPMVLTVGGVSALFLSTTSSATGSSGGGGGAGGGGNNGGGGSTGWLELLVALGVLLGRNASRRILQ